MGSGVGAVQGGSLAHEPVAFMRALATVSTQVDLLDVVGSWVPRVTGARTASLRLHLGGAGPAPASGTSRRADARGGAGAAEEFGLDAATPSSVSLVPVLVQGAPRGVLELGWGGPAPLADHAVAGAAEHVAELVGWTLWRLEAAEAAAHLAHHDSLTGLVNRRSVDDHLMAWAQDEQTAPHLTVVLCDVNGLKKVNDEHGHLVGDQHLIDIADLARRAAARLPGAVAGRLGGDEFVLLSPRATYEQVLDVVEELGAAALRLPHGAGLSCGTAAREDVVRRAPGQSLARMLLRMADAEQYRQKLDARVAACPRTQAAPAAKGRAGTPVPGPVHSSSEGPAVGLTGGRTRSGGIHPSGTAMSAAPSITALVHRLQRGGARPGGDDVLDALQLVTTTVCSLAGGAAWFISRADTTHVWAVGCGTPRTLRDRDGQWPDVEVDPTRYVLSDFPATVQALSGGSFHVSATDGEPAERRLLAETGFRAVIAAGGSAPDIYSRQRPGPDGGGEVRQRTPGAATPSGSAEGPPTGSWLVEVYADALTPDLAAHEGLLLALTTLALTRAPTRAPD